MRFVGTDHVPPIPSQRLLCSSRTISRSSPLGKTCVTLGIPVWIGRKKFAAHFEYCSVFSIQYIHPTDQPKQFPTCIGSSVVQNKQCERYHQVHKSRRWWWVRPPTFSGTVYVGAISSTVACMLNGGWFATFCRVAPILLRDSSKV